MADKGIIFSGPMVRNTKFGDANAITFERWSNQTDSGQNRIPPSAGRWLERSATYPGIAAAMGEQWGGAFAAIDQQMRLFS